MKASMLGWGLLIAMPLLVKQGLPPVVTAISQQSFWGPSQSQQSDWVVEAVGSGKLIIRNAAGTQRQVYLAGLGPVDDRWQREATGILAALLRDSNAQVQVTFVSPTAALIRLPNQTLLQRILLTDGVAKLDSVQLSGLPPSVVMELQQAEQSAKQQQKNVWGIAP